MRLNSNTLHELHDNINTICSLNEKKNTCLPEKLINIIYKKSNKENQINLQSSINIIDKLSHDCKCNKKETITEKELCIIKKIDENIINNNMKECIIYNYFKPLGSHNGKDWLNNTHIDIIQEQLYKKYQSYYYGFIHMIDNVMIKPKNIMCINHPVKSITDIDFINQINNKNELNTNNEMKWYGVIYNTDTSDNTGQHWFAILINFSTKGTENDPYLIEYFNSSGFNIQNKNFKEFLEKLALSISYETDKRTIFKKVTDIQHQSEETGNCGIYALYYIWSRINNIPLEYFNNPKNKITDEQMEYMRKILFRKE
jgi:hypothetical protein